MEARITRKRVAASGEMDDRPAESLARPEEIRTPGPLIRSQLLYPLSYGRRAVATACAGRF